MANRPERAGDAALVVHGGLVARNTLLNGASQLLPILAAVVAIPPVVAGLGEARFGVLGIAWVVLGYFAELGFGRATTKFVADVLGDGLSEQVAGVTWAAAAIQLVLGLAAGLALYLATPAIVGTVLNVPGDLVAEAARAFRILGFALPVVLLSSSFRGALEAAQRFDLVNAVRVPVAVATSLLPLLGVLVGWTLPGIVALLLVARVSGTLAYLALDLMIFPSMRGLPKPARESWRPVFGFGGWVAVSSVISPMLVYLDRVMLGALLSMTAVAYYTAPYELVSRLWIVPSSLTATLFPALSVLGRQAAWEQVEALTARSLKFVLFLLGPLIIAIVAGAPDILGLWLGEEFARESALALQILAVGILVNSMSQVLYSLLQGFGRADLTAMFHIAEFPVHILLTWILVLRWGVAGAAMAWTIRVTLDGGLLLAAVLRLVPVSGRAFVAERVPQTAVALLLSGITGLILAEAIGPIQLRIVAVALVVGFVALLIWRYSLAPAERARLTGLLRQIRSATPDG